MSLGSFGDSPMKARVTVTLKTGILDPQGKAIEGALKSLGVAGVASVRQGKVFDIELEGADRIVLDTLADNVRAVRFYEHKGYHILALKPDGPPGRDAFMSVRLEKRLSPYRGPVPDAR